MRPGPITSTCFPSECAEAAFTIETAGEREPVSFMMNESIAFSLELARVHTLRAHDPLLEPITIRLLLGDQEIKKEIA